MAYSTSLPPILVTQGLTGSYPRTWLHYSVDASADVDASGFITNGGDLGMQVNDLVQHTDTNLGIVSSHKVATVSSTAPGAVDLADGTVIGSATNSD